VLDALDLRPGEVKENVTVSGIAVNQLPAGSRIAAGEAVFELTKECAPCTRMEEIREGLQERLVKKRGVYARVVTPGVVRPGDPVTIKAASPSEAVAGS
jgi:MOSC domain-containing protein YiiM